jgi:hypothetical protein
MVSYKTCITIVIYETTARRHFLGMTALFKARATKGRVLHSFICANVLNTSSHIEALCLICRIPFVNRMALVHVCLPKCQSNYVIAIHLHSFEIFIIQIREMAFCKPEFIIIKSNYFQNAQKGECFLDDFKVFALVTSALTSISRTTMRLRNVILKVVSSKITVTTYFFSYLIL